MSNQTRSHPPITNEHIGVELSLVSLIVPLIKNIEEQRNKELKFTAEEVKNIQNIIDTLDTIALPGKGTNSAIRKQCFNTLRKVSPGLMVLPTSHSVRVTLEDTTPVASGGFADIWKGQTVDGKPVRVKRFRHQRDKELEDIKRRFYREIVLWKRLDHPTVVPFLGISEPPDSFSFISPWLPNGNILEYTNKHEGVNRLQLLSQAASGLEYLHSFNVVHSAISPGNILINDDGTACLADFGITAIITNPGVVDQGSTTVAKCGAVRYMAPELLNPPKYGLNNSNPTKKSDVYALAMTTYEVLTDILPFGELKDATINFIITSGARPPYQPSIQGQIWAMITKCWSEKWSERFDAQAVYLQLSASSTQAIAEVEQVAMKNPCQGIRQQLTLAVQPSTIQKQAPRRTLCSWVKELFGLKK